jgi:hypothetical protein
MEPHMEPLMEAWWRGRSWRFWLTVLSPLLVMGACGLFFARSRQMGAEAERAAALFHKQLAAGQYDAIYDAAGVDFRTAVNRWDAGRLLATVHIKMGECQTPAGSLGYFTNMNTSGTRVQLRYRLACANGALDETLAYAPDAGGLRLVGYDFRSPTLILK